MLCKMTHGFGLLTELVLPTRRTVEELGAFWQRLPLKWMLGVEVRHRIRHLGLTPVGVPTLLS